MNSDKEKWIDQVFDSVKDSRRAIPDPQLLAQIESRIQVPAAKLIPISQWRFAAAAAILLLALNVIGLRQYQQSNNLNATEYVMGESSEQALLSNYQLYE